MNKDNYIVLGKFEVILQTGEYSYEMASGPYNTYQEAESASKRWHNPEDIPHMRIIRFYYSNKQ